MSENKISFDAIQVKNIKAAHEKGLGAFCYTKNYTHLLAMMPDKDGIPTLTSFNISDEKQRPYWHWDCNRERPTLSPSLHWPGHWHGFLRQGRFESV